MPLLAQLWVKYNYRKFLKTANAKGISGREVARAILEGNGLGQVSVKETPGEITDFYASGNKSVNLSEGVFGGQSIASIAIAAHECGHALQDRDGYVMMRMRHSLHPVVRFSNKVAYFLVIAGIIVPFLGLGWLGTLILLISLMYEVVTLPVEFNASKRALAEVERLGLADEQEMAGVRAMLRSAALTYVAAVASSAAQLLRLVLLRRRRA